MIDNASHQSTIVMASVVCCFSIHLTLPKGALWGNTRLSKHRSAKKAPHKNLHRSAWVFARKRFWSKTPAFPNTPQFHHFHSGITGQLSDSADGGRNKMWWQKQDVVTAVCVCHRAGYLGVWGGGSPAPVCTAWQRVSPQWALAPPKFILYPCQPYPAQKTFGKSE